MKKKISFIVLLLVLGLLAYRLLFCYTVFSIPIGTPFLQVGEVFCGGSKYDFPICVINPIKIKKIEKLMVDSSIINDYEPKLIKDGEYRFKIVAVNNEEEELCFLLRDKETNRDICIVFTDKKGSEVRRLKR